MIMIMRCITRGYSYCKLQLELAIVNSIAYMRRARSRLAVRKSAAPDLPAARACGVIELVSDRARANPKCSLNMTSK